MLYSLGSNLTTYLELPFIKVEHPEKPAFTAYDNLLKRYALGGFIDYEKLRGSKELEAAIAELKSTSPDRLANDDYKMAYWGNAYNLLAIKNICDRYPVRLLPELHESRGGKRYIVGGQICSLKDIEEILKQYMRTTDWRALMLMCPGALGYPRVPDVPFMGDKLETQMTAAVKEFVLRPDNYMFDDGRSKVYLSKFYQWNRSTIDSVYGSPAMLLNTCLPPAEQFDPVAYPFSYSIPFDWRINDIKYAPKLEEALKNSFGNNETAVPAQEKVPDKEPAEKEEPAQPVNGKEGDTGKPAPETASPQEKEGAH